MVLKGYKYEGGETKYRSAFTAGGHEEMEWQNSMLLQASQIQAHDFIQEESVPPLAISLPRSLLSKIKLWLERISQRKFLKENFTNPYRQPKGLFSVSFPYSSLCCVSLCVGRKSSLYRQ